MKNGQGWQRNGKLLAACVLMGMATLARAEYVWIDEKGIKHLSDRPPPPSVPVSRILKVPSASRQGLVPVETPPPEMASGVAPAALKAVPTTAERDADFQKRKAEAAQQAQKAADDAARKADLAANCDSARQNQRLLDSGRRITSVDRNGERVFISDEERVRQEKRTQRSLADCK